MAINPKPETPLEQTEQQSTKDQLSPKKKKSCTHHLNLHSVMEFVQERLTMHEEYIFAHQLRHCERCLENARAIAKSARVLAVFDSRLKLHMKDR